MVDSQSTLIIIIFMIISSFVDYSVGIRRFFCILNTSLVVSALRRTSKHLSTKLTARSSAICDHNILSWCIANCGVIEVIERAGVYPTQHTAVRAVQCNYLTHNCMGNNYWSKIHTCTISRHVAPPPILPSWSTCMRWFYSSFESVSLIGTQNDYFSTYCYKCMHL